ncbi:hypothetical protein [Aminobacter niigataensis]|uniref:hypothetical protein n=1 Tax=Aminobacter niigataensis TaxID=83265 RepID=UPI00298EFACA|nr:hypothetical protein [Aminobacter niigataensis]
MAKFSPRDHSRTEQGTALGRVLRNTGAPRDQGAWMPISCELLESMAFRTLSPNASKVFYRIIIEHLRHGRTENGRLIVTHAQFTDYGVTSELIADAIDELAFKGLIKVSRGRAGNGTAHPNSYRLTLTGTHDGAAATNDWKACTRDTAKMWTETVRDEMRAKRAAKKSSLREGEVRPLREPEVRRAG